MNVVFDLGGVVFDWRPEALLRQEFADPAIRERVREHVLLHRDWVELDRGSISLDDAVDRGAQRSGLPAAEVARFLAAVPPSLTPIVATIDLIRAVRNAGHSLFVLSNMHHASIDFLEQEHAIWDLFDGTVISCRVNKVKPEPDIYATLLAEFHLDAAATVFIDDLEENVAAAAAMGIHTIRFTDAAQCRRDLERIGGLRKAGMS